MSKIFNKNIPYTFTGGINLSTSANLSISNNSNTIGNMFTTGGNVGINTVSPNGRLQISSGTTTGNISIDALSGANDGFSYIGFNGYNNAAGNEVRINSNKLRWRLATDQRTASDNILIDAHNGTSFPYILRFQVGTQGNVKLNTTGEARYHLYNNAGVSEWLFGQKSSTRSDFTISKLVVSTETDYLTITTGGNVGIGTTSPAYTLDINGSLRSNNINYLTSSTAIQATTNNYSLTSGSLNVSGDIVLSGTELMFTQTNVGPPTMNGRSSGSKIVLYPSQAAATGDFSMGIDFGTMWFQVPLQSHVYRFYHGTTANFNISTAGNVGIGITSPATALHVVQPSGTAAVTIQNSSSTGNSSIDFFNYSSGYIGSVGFGNTASSSGGAFRNTLFLYHNNQDAVFVGSGTTERMRVTASGNVGIGITSPSTNLHIYNATNSINDMVTIHGGASGQNNGGGRIYIGGNANHYSAIEGYHTDNGRTWIKLKTTGNVTGGAPNSPQDRMIIDWQGNVGIGTMSPTSTLHVNGVVSATGLTNIPSFCYINGSATISNPNSPLFNGSVHIDNKSGFNATTGKYTIPMTGFYNVSFNVRLNDSNVSGAVVVATTRSGTTTYTPDVWIPVDPANRRCASYTRLMSLISGDVIFITMSPNSASGSIAIIEMSVHLVSIA